MARLIPVAPFDCVIFGATGDLALRKLLPSLYHRWLDGQIPATSRMIAASRQEISNAEFHRLVRLKFEEFRPDEVIKDVDWTAFTSQLDYCRIDVADQAADWSGLRTCLSEGERRIRIFYFALPPSIYGEVAHNIVAAGLKTPLTRIVLEKPIGTDLKSARAINDAIGQCFDEHQVFRIDHYLGKETVQNLLILRFANSIFEPVWNANGIDHVQISVSETVGAGERADYYDRSGALRDMLQNHLMQLLCLVAMEPPLGLDGDFVRDEKNKVLRALRPYTQSGGAMNGIRGQYTAGTELGAMVQGYKDKLGRESTTETFVALKAYIDNWRWSGVPFYLRTGKSMSEKRSEIIIQFKSIAHSIVGAAGESLLPSRLVIRLQPDEGVKLMLMTKEPGPGGLKLRYVPLNLSYAETFSERYPDAYERLLMDVVRGNLGLFMRRDEVEAAWRWIDGILEEWERHSVAVYGYPAGTNGPVQSAVMMDRDGREWFGDV